MSIAKFDRRINYICISVAIGGLLFGFDTAVISGAITLVKVRFALDAAMEGWLVSSGLAGSILGVLLSGALSNAIGRKKTIYFAGVMFLLSGLGCFFSDSINFLVVWRMVGGIGVGMASVISPMYIAEFAPADKRGRMISYYQLAITAGILLAYFSNAMVAGISSGNGLHLFGHIFLKEESWRLMFLMMCLPSILFIILLVKVPESPRWLMLVNREPKAKFILQKVRSIEAADKEIEGIKKERMKFSKSSASLFSPYMRIPLLIGMVLAILQQFSGINAIIYYGPRIFESAGISSSNALLFQVIIGAINVLFTFVAIKYADKYGRKFLLKFGLSGIILSLVVCGYLFYSGHTQGPLLLVCMLVYIACFAFSLGPITWVIINEIFPSNVRVKAVTACTLALWIAVWLVGQFFPWLLEKTSAAFTFWVFAGFSLINLLFSLNIVRETKGKTLEEVNELFVSPH